MKFKIFKFKKVKSTNSTAIRIIRNTNLNYGMIISETQNGGRGQYGKKWISYKGNLFVSFFYKLENLTFTLNQLTKINCLLVQKTLSLYYKKKIIFKTFCYIPKFCVQAKRRMLDHVLLEHVLHTTYLIRKHIRLRLLLAAIKGNKDVHHLSVNTL